MTSEVQLRKLRTIKTHEQENLAAIRAKPLNAVPTKRPGLAVLREVTSNIQVQRDAVVGKTGTGKVAETAAEIEKRVRPIRSNSYKYVQSKIDTGLASKPVQSLKPPTQQCKLSRRVESTTTLRTVTTKGALKENLDSDIKPIEHKVKRDLKKNQKLALKKVVEDEQIIDDQAKNLLNLSLSPKLPEDIEDIDASDGNNPLQLTRYIKDIYFYLTHLENKFPINKDHLKNQSFVTGHMRSVLVDWLVQVQQQFKLGLETFQLTVGVLDRYLQAVPNIQRNQLQLVGVAAMFIAAKYEEVYSPDVKDFVYVTDNAYTKEDIFKYERDIMLKLDFCLARPIPLSFLRRFIKAAKGSSKNHHLAKYLVDLCLVEYSMCHYKPSELAAAAICLSLQILSIKKRQEVWTPTLSHYSGYSLSHIEPIMVKIAAIVDNVKKSKYTAVYEKYQDIMFAKVATLPQLQCSKVSELMVTN